MNRKILIVSVTVLFVLGISIGIFFSFLIRDRSVFNNSPNGGSAAKNVSNSNFEEPFVPDNLSISDSGNFSIAGNSSSSGRVGIKQAVSYASGVPADFDTEKFISDRDVSKNCFKLRSSGVYASKSLVIKGTEILIEGIDSNVDDSSYNRTVCLPEEGCAVMDDWVLVRINDKEIKGVRAEIFELTFDNGLEAYFYVADPEPSTSLGSDLCLFSKN